MPASLCAVLGKALCPDLEAHKCHNVDFDVTRSLIRTESIVGKHLSAEHEREDRGPLKSVSA